MYTCRVNSSIEKLHTENVLKFKVIGGKYYINVHIKVQLQSKDVDPHTLFTRF